MSELDYTLIGVFVFQLLLFVGMTGLLFCGFPLKEFFCEIVGRGGVGLVLKILKGAPYRSFWLLSGAYIMSMTPMMCVNEIYKAASTELCNHPYFLISGAGLIVALFLFVGLFLPARKEREIFLKTRIAALSE